MDLGLRGKVALVTGASRGIGFAVSMALAEEGAKVVVVARDGQRLQSAAESISAKAGVEVIPLTADLRRTGDTKRVVDSALKSAGRIDILVNNAGSSAGGSIAELTDEDWESSVSLKFMGYVRMCREVIPIMVKQGGGKVINIVGNDGVKPIHFEIAPSTANAADIAMTVALAEHYGYNNVTVNAVNPGPVLTDRWRELEARMARTLGVSAEEAHSRALRSIPLGRLCTPSDVANLVVFLASSKADFINGAVINIDGGQRKALLEGDHRASG
jgi:NAD(P)-dependent dehydrogenase (short-subunit alcohol dehydrogenase family)